MKLCSVLRAHYLFSLQVLKGENPYVYFNGKNTNLEILSDLLAQRSIVSSDKK